MRLGYNTNGLAHHSLPAAIEMLADLGYQSVAITLDHCCLNPYDDNFERNLNAAAELLATRGMRSVVETGARYLLDPRHKHEPTLASPDDEQRLRRIGFLHRSIDAAAALGSDCVSLWSGRLADEDGRDEAMSRLADGLRRVVQYADERDVLLGFEPEPGMLIDGMAAYEELADRLASPRLRLTLDVGHLHCLGETPIDAVIRRWSSRIVNVHIEDMRAGVHEHLMFGEGEIDFPPIIAALAEVGYDGGIHVELSRHSHDGPVAAARAFNFLAPLIRHYA
ncbi:MAG: sugar phosphate isomerase/epimerase [Planctomycetota bacterium]|nr:MAG: sugar phosphate isomerase/epimerase [Planctomycetota bacterium]